MMYAKKTNVLEQFEKKMKEDTREVSEDDTVVVEEQKTKAASPSPSMRSA